MKAKVGRGLRIKGASVIQLDGQDITVGEDVTIDGNLSVRFDNPYHGSLEIEGGSRITLAVFGVEEGQRVKFSQGKPDLSTEPIPGIIIRVPQSLDEIDQLAEVFAARHLSNTASKELRYIEATRLAVD
ncbi:MAG: hypothetical protein JRI96_18055, partial [Deltaproteobacteria bacterium]|nr:hypothetical protein [Deltaproteobacteria bacterium]